MPVTINYLSGGWQPLGGVTMNVGVHEIMVAHMAKQVADDIDNLVLSGQGLGKTSLAASAAFYEFTGILKKIEDVG